MQANVYPFGSAPRIQNISVLPYFLYEILLFKRIVFSGVRFTILHHRYMNSQFALLVSTDTIYLMRQLPEIGDLCQQCLFHVKCNMESGLLKFLDHGTAQCGQSVFALAILMSDVRRKKTEPMR